MCEPNESAQQHDETDKYSVSSLEIFCHQTTPTNWSFRKAKETKRTKEKCSIANIPNTNGIFVLILRAMKEFSGSVCMYGQGTSVRDKENKYGE